jgi:hypothetical protein
MCCWLLHCEFGLLDDICVEGLVQEYFVGSIQCCIPLPFSENYILGEVNSHGQWIGYEVLLSQYAVVNEYAASGSVIQLLSLLICKVHRSQASDHMEMLQQ